MENSDKGHKVDMLNKLDKVSYPDLPVSSARDEIITALEQHQVIVVVGATGSGKTTQLPKMALEYLRSNQSKKRVGCTQPRRIAAASVAKRVSEEMDVALGQEVGYQVRFEDFTTEKTAVKFMTDGILLAETQGDDALAEYGVVIIDEAHERSLNIDFLLGYLKRLVERRKDLRVVISSATLDAGGFSEFYENAPLINVEGRTFPVETEYLVARDDEYLAQHVARAVEGIDDLGDILVFLPGEREIRECAEMLEGRRIANTEILPLYARMGMSEQQRVFTTINGVRRVVLATNVAETSLTIPGIVYVIDAGVARVSRWNPSRQVQRLQVEKISQASARQRKGRCGRVREGVCIRLYSEEDFEERPEFTDPEIRRSSLGGVILRMKSLKLPEISEFPFIDPPSSKHIAEGYRTLREIGALNEEEGLTDVGWKLARVPVEPRLARMLLESIEVGCYPEVLVIVSGLSVMDPRERPSDKQQEADAAHKRWDDEESDFTSLLHLWSELMEYRDKRGWMRNKLRKFCKRGYLNFRRVMEWGNLHAELAQIKLGKKPAAARLGNMQQWASHEVLHKALLIGMPRQIGKYDKDARSYKGVNAKEFAIFPGSGMFGQKKPEWILAYDMVDTSRLWARKVAKVEAKWIEEVVPQLCRYRYHGACWDRKQGAVYAKEVVVFGPLTIVDGRNVHYGRIDSKASWKIFIRDGLLGKGLHAKPRCLRVLDSLRDKVLDMEQRLRRVDGIWSDEKVIDFFEEKIPTTIFTAKAFLKWESKHGEDVLLDMQDVMYDDVYVIQKQLQGYPTVVEDSEQEYSVYYRVAHGESDDGVTFGVHVDQLLTMSQNMVLWGVMGMLEERVFLLIRSLPKGQRVACNPTRDRARDFVEWVSSAKIFGQGDLLVMLGDYLSNQTGMRIEATMFDVQRLPYELRTKVWVCDDDGNELAMGEDVDALRHQLGSLLDQRFEQESGAEWEMSGMKGWECGELPQSIEVRGKLAYPALVDEGVSVGVKVYLTEIEANQNHLAGCVRLFLLQYYDHAKYVTKHLPISLNLKMYLPHLGEKGITQAELLRCATQAEFVDVMPRNEHAFHQLAEQTRGELYANVGKLGEVLEHVIDYRGEVISFIEKNLKNNHLGEVAEDLEVQLKWLLRGGFLLQSGWKWVSQYSRYFQGMLDRLQRLNQYPVIKDLEKMDQLLELLQPWEDKWKHHRDDIGLMETGYFLEELRLLYFAPTHVRKGLVSEKKVKNMLESKGVI